MSLLPLNRAGRPLTQMGSGRSAGAWSPTFGATAWGGEVRFRVWAPGKGEVCVIMEGGGKREKVRMQPTGGVHEARADGGGGLRYWYSLEGGPPTPDPASLAQPDGVHGPSMVVDTSSFEWRDEGWRGVPTEDLVIYELHTGTFTEAGTFDGVIPRLGHLRRELGVTAIEVMPVAQFPGRRDWGYDGVFPYAAQNSYGGAPGLARLVDACHAEGLAVILDVVYNHLGPEGNCLTLYAPYFSERYRTPWGAAINYDGPGSDMVRRYVVDNALYWVRALHVDGLRLDAVHAIFDSSPKHILTQLAEDVHEAAESLGRVVAVIGESDLNDPKVVKGKQECGYGLDAQWADDLHHSIHTALTGERFGYYQDYRGEEDVAAAFREPFVLDGKYSGFRGRNHGAPSTGVPGNRFVVFAQNHDQVGNRADGARLGVLAGEEGGKTAAAVAILSPYIPLIFMGEEFGSRSPFHFFCDYSVPEVVRGTREGRRRELEGQGRPFVDPQSVSAFEASRPDHGESASPQGVRTLGFYRALINFRADHPAVRAPRENSAVARSDGLVAVRRWGGGEQVLLVFVFRAGASPVRVPGGVHWELALSSNGKTPRTMASGERAAFTGPSASAYVEG